MTQQDDWKEMKYFKNHKMSFAKPPHVQSEKKKPMEQRKGYTKFADPAIGKHAIQVNAVSKTKVEKEMNKGAADSGLLHKEEDDTYGLKINFKESPVRIRDSKKEFTVANHELDYDEEDDEEEERELQESDWTKKSSDSAYSKSILNPRREENIRVKYEWTDEDDPELVRIAEYAEWANEDDPELVEIEKSIGNM